MFGLEGWRKQKVDPAEVAERRDVNEIQDIPVARNESKAAARQATDEELEAIAADVEKDETAGSGDDDDGQIGWKHAA